jgi:SAM-dependent methyltransferase
MSSVPDWKLPTGISRGLWAYINDAQLAKSCDDRLAKTPLLNMDLRLVESYFPEAGRLVDLGCGTGRLLIPRAQRGFSVLGVDLSPEMLKVAREKARQAEIDLPLIQANLVELDCVRDEVFDYAACLFSTLGMISGADNRRRALAHMIRILKPGGRFILHVHNLWFHLGTSAGRRWLWRDRWSRLRHDDEFGDFEMPAHDGIAGLALHHFSRREILRELRAVGFRIRIVQPISTHSDGRLPVDWLLPGLRAYGFLIAAEREQK